MGNPVDELFDHARKIASRVVVMALERAIQSAQAAIRRSVQSEFQSLAGKIGLFTSVLGKLPHGTANVVADSYRGPFARALTPAEVKIVTWAFGKQPVAPSQVRIVPGPGLQTVAAIAFLNGNPAITIGNTIYIKQRVYRERGGSNLAATPEGVEMLLHEYTHVLQYGRLGFARFGARYAAEFKAAGGDANKMYDYKHRKKGFNDESIEGQAALVGDFGEQLALPPVRRTPALIRQLRSKLNGTGILGQ
ncbi:DUF4157 domain-containing protein [Sphingomonas endolithica]|uniref:DUF4157 domain-containing protein n=1 Tax=Sphingomonas endolithica TaxID=2972485 RepID=UPI0021AF4F20|nr:DUF4157 domain-containing protein [Sphingomonas sp. ZFBP2030]